MWGVEDEHQIPGQGVDILGIWWDVTPIPPSPPQFLVGLESTRIKAWTSYCLHWSYFLEFLLLYTGTCCGSSAAHNVCSSRGLSPAGVVLS